MTAAGLQAIAALDPLREAGFRLVSGPAGRQPSLVDLDTIPSDIVGWIAGVEPIGALALDRFRDLRVISRNGAGADAIDTAEADRRGVRVVTARGANARGVAELAIAHILNALRHLSGSNAALHDGRWERSLGREMPEVVLGVVGYGAIGRLVAEFALAMGSTVLAYDPYADQDTAEAVIRVSLDELLQRSDVVSLHSPPAADGRALVGRRELDLLPLDAVLVNTARSSLVDEEAVLAALASGRLSAYSVDAFDEEPPALTPLLRHPATILTPHLGGFTKPSIARATEQSVTNLLDILIDRR